MRYSLLIFTLFFSQISLSQTPAHDLVKASIKYHDPDNKWPTIEVLLGFSDTRPGADPRSASLFLNNSKGIVCIMREQDGNKITRHIIGDNCSYDVNGAGDFSESDIEKYSLNDDRSLMLRNYYLYLWGLPMKLQDSGTIIGPEVMEKSFNGRNSKAVRVTYNENVGSDIWYFYFDPKSNEMIGYQFYHDEDKGDGEYIILDDIEEVNGLKIPKSRTWFTNADSSLLGSDHLIHSYALHSHH